MPKKTKLTQGQRREMFYFAYQFVKNQLNDTVEAKTVTAARISCEEIRPEYDRRQKIFYDAEDEYRKLQNKAAKPYQDLVESVDYIEDILAVWPEAESALKKKIDRQSSPSVEEIQNIFRAATSNKSETTEPSNAQS